MTTDLERQMVLEMVANGQISAEQGAELLNALILDEDEAQEILHDETRTIFIQPEADSNPFARWRQYWWLPFLLGSLLILGPGWLIWRLSSTSPGFWSLLCLRIPAWIGGLVSLGIAWAMRWGTWIHVRVKQPPGEWPASISLSFPLPLRTAAWCLHTFGRWIPHVKQFTWLDKAILALSKDRDNPLWGEVHDDDGTHVQFCIG